MRRKAVGVGGELVRSQLMVSEEEKKEVSCRSLLSHLRKVRQSFFKPKQPVKESHISRPRSVLVSLLYSVIGCEQARGG